MERWVEAVLSPTDQAKCDLLGIKVMSYTGANRWGMGTRPAFSVRSRHGEEHRRVINLCSLRGDTVIEVCIFRSTDEAIKGATNKKYFFPGVT